MWSKETALYVIQARFLSRLKMCPLLQLCFPRSVIGVPPWEGMGQTCSSDLRGNPCHESIAHGGWFFSDESGPQISYSISKGGKSSLTWFCHKWLDFIVCLCTSPNQISMLAQNQPSRKPLIFLPILLHLSPGITKVLIFSFLSDWAQFCLAYTIWNIHHPRLQEQWIFIIPSSQHTQRCLTVWLHIRKSHLWGSLWKTQITNLYNIEQGQCPNYGNYDLKKGCISDDALPQHWFIGAVVVILPCEERISAIKLQHYSLVLFPRLLMNLQIV